MENNVSQFPTQDTQDTQTLKFTPEILKEIQGLEEQFEDASDGLAILGVIFNLSDEAFELMRPVFQDAMREAYHEPQAQMQLMQMLAQSGFTVDDLLSNTDEIIKAIANTDELDISDAKRDFLKFMFTEIATAVGESTLNPAHIVNIPIILCREGAKLPTYATDGSAAMDLYATDDYTIDPGETKLIPTGLKVKIPHGYALLIQPRSGMSARTKLRIPNSPGLIDEDYHEEIQVIIENVDPFIKDVGTVLINDKQESSNLYGTSFFIGKGERFAQMRLIEVPRVKWQEVTSFGGFETDEDHGKGFGSTGMK